MQIIITTITTTTTQDYDWVKVVRKISCGVDMLTSAGQRDLTKGGGEGAARSFYLRHVLAGL